MMKKQSLVISGHCLMPECWAIGCRYLQALRPFGGPIWRIWRVWYTNIMWWRNMENILWYDMTKYDTMRYHMMYGQHWTAPSFHGVPFSSFSAEPKIFFPRQMAPYFLCIDITCSMECCANGWTRTLVSSTRTDLDWSCVLFVDWSCWTATLQVLWWAFRSVLLYKKKHDMMPHCRTSIKTMKACTGSEGSDCFRVELQQKETLSSCALQLATSFKVRQSIATVQKRRQSINYGFSMILSLLYMFTYFYLIAIIDIMFIKSFI
jgi:hypothetical protein